MPIYAAGPRPATMTLAPTSRRCIKHTLDRYLPLRSSTTKQRNSADPAPQIIARIASGPVSPDSSRAQISIAPARHRPTFPDRGFLPWRLSDAGRRCTWHRRVRPASETLHMSGHAGRITPLGPPCGGHRRRISKRQSTKMIGVRVSWIDLLKLAPDLAGLLRATQMAQC